MIDSLIFKHKEGLSHMHIWNRRCAESDKISTKEQTQQEASDRQKPTRQQTFLRFCPFRTHEDGPAYAFLTAEFYKFCIGRFLFSVSYKWAALLKLEYIRR